MAKHGAAAPAAPASNGLAPLRVTVRPRAVRRGVRTLLRVRVRSGGAGVNGALVRVGGKRARTGQAAAAHGCATASSAGRAAGSYG